MVTDGKDNNDDETNDDDCTVVKTYELSPDSFGNFRDQCRVVAEDGTSIDVLPEKSVVGRAPGSALVLTDERISKAHLELYATDEGVVVRDIGTTNGSYIGSVRFHQLVLTSDTTLTLGGPDGPKVRFVYDGTRTRVEPPSEKTRFERLVGRSAPMRHLYARLAEFAPTDISLLIEGETGTGKEEVARSIHAASNRADGPFVVVDCGALAPSLLESILYGYEKGAFSGANSRKIGLAESADGGTLFLDEIGEFPSEAQTRLLRLIDRHEIQRVGSNTYKKIDIRVVAATHRDIPKMISDGDFRADLFFRLAVARIFVPPLRERRDDIPMLVQTLLDRLAFSPRPAVTQAALEEFCRFDYTGNVRDLRNVVQVARALGKEIIDAEHVRSPPVYPAAKASPTLLDDTIFGGHFGPFRAQKELVICRFEQLYLEHVMNECEGVQQHAATAAGVTRKTMRALLIKHGYLPGPDHGTEEE